VKKDLSVIGGLFLVVVVLVLFGNFFGTGGLLKGIGSNQATPSAKIAKDSTIVSIGKLSVNAKIASTPNDKKTGLSKNDSLALDQGMLFIFDKSDIYPFWMKGMKFAIDIIWLDQNKKVVDIAKNVSPEPGKNDVQLKQYKPATAAKYVLEVNAGLGDLNNVQVGDTANFEL
jgi:hypothetical protein